MGILVKKKRKEKHLSISKLSSLSGVTKKDIIKIELGCIKHPFLNIILLLSERLNISMKEITDCDAIYSYDLEVMRQQCDDAIKIIDEMMEVD